MFLNTISYTSSLRNHNRGLALEELGQLLVELGASYAINMDGGGSSTMVYDLQVISRPTCLDIPLVCQRPVATVMCISPPMTFGLTAQMLY
jgi:exopolysaccharide biosynthesis protein